MSTNSVITNGDNQWCLNSRCFAMDSYCEPGSRCSGMLWRNHECTSTSWHDNIGRRPHTGSSAITTDRGSWTQMTHKGAAPASSEVWIQHSFIHWMLMLMLHETKEHVRCLKTWTNKSDMVPRAAMPHPINHGAPKTPPTFMGCETASMATTSDNLLKST